MSKIIDFIRNTLTSQNDSNKKGTVHSNGLPNGKFPFLSLSEIASKLSPPSFLVNKYLERDTITTLYGESDTKKTFVSLDMGLSIAYGLDYHGESVMQGGVFYICGEGHSGVGRRIEAWKIAHGVRHQDAPFYVSEIPAQLSDDEHLIAIKHAIADLSHDHSTSPLLVIVDTISANFGDGDESSNRDASRLINHLNSHIRYELGASLLLVMHVGHADKLRERGAYAFRGNVDSRILSENTGDETIRISCQKSKDSEKWDDLHFKAKFISIPGLLNGDEPIGSLVLERTEGNPGDGQDKKLRDTQREIIKALDESCIEQIIKAHSGAIGIPRDQLIKRLKETDPAKRKDNLIRSLDTLIDKEVMSEVDGLLISKRFLKILTSTK